MREDSALRRPWVVCEQGNRWTTAVQRFFIELVPQTSSSRGGSISRISPAEASTLCNTKRCHVVLWEIDPADFVTACDQIAQLAIEMPRTLQLAAVAGLSSRELLVLSELGIAATVRHPEHLPSLQLMIHGHFARVA